MCAREEGGIGVGHIGSVRALLTAGTRSSTETRRAHHVQSSDGHASDRLHSWDQAPGDFPWSGRHAPPLARFEHSSSTSGIGLSSPRLVCRDLEVGGVMAGSSVISTWIRLVKVFVKVGSGRNNGGAKGIP
jgi:hypothetical protein